MAASVTQIVSADATRKGALAGFSARCECCGMELRSSQRTLLEQDVEAHIAYHAKRGDA